MFQENATALFNKNAHNHLFANQIVILYLGLFSFWQESCPTLLRYVIFRKYLSYSCDIYIRTNLPLPLIVWNDNAQVFIDNNFHNTFVPIYATLI